MRVSFNNEATPIKKRQEYSPERSTFNLENQNTAEKSPFRSTASPNKSYKQLEIEDETVRTLREYILIEK
jgi:hypothetical protein